MNAIILQLLDVTSRNAKLLYHCSQSRPLSRADGQPVPTVTCNFSIGVAKAGGASWSSSTACCFSCSASIVRVTKRYHSWCGPKSNYLAEKLQANWRREKSETQHSKLAFCNLNSWPKSQSGTVLGYIPFESVSLFSMCVHLVF